MKSKLIYLMLLSAFGSLASCSKSDPPVTPEKPIVTVPVLPPPITTPPTDVPPTSTAKLVPVKIESPGQSIVFKYVGETNSLLSIDDGAEKKTTITYNNNQMKGLLIHQGDKTYYVDYFRDTQNRINQVNQWNQTNDEDIPLGYYTIIYDDLQQISEVNYFSAKNALLRKKEFTYDLSNDRMGIITETNGTETTKYTFDLNNGIFKNVANAQLIALETGEIFLLSADHNLLSITSSNPKNDLTCSYEYNTDAYPTSITWEALHVKMKYIISYKTL